MAGYIKTENGGIIFYDDNGKSFNFSQRSKTYSIVESYCRASDFGSVVELIESVYDISDIQDLEYTDYFYYKGEPVPSRFNTMFSNLLADGKKITIKGLIHSLEGVLATTPTPDFHSINFNILPPKLEVTAFGKVIYKNFDVAQGYALPHKRYSDKSYVKNEMLNTVKTLRNHLWPANIINPAEAALQEHMGNYGKTIKHRNGLVIVEDYPYCWGTGTLVMADSVCQFDVNSLKLHLTEENDYFEKNTTVVYTE